MASRILFVCLFAVLINVVYLLPYYDDRYDYDYRYNDNRYYDDRYDSGRYYVDSYYGDRYYDGRYDDNRYYDSRYYDGRYYDGRYYDGRYNYGRSSECRDEFEYYERCPENVCYKDCRDVKNPPSYCPDRHASCHSSHGRCLCIEGYYRNEHGRCVQYNDCWDNYYSRPRNWWY